MNETTTRKSGRTKSKAATSLPPVIEITATDITPPTEVSTEPPAPQTDADAAKLTEPAVAAAAKIDETSTPPGPDPAGDPSTAAGRKESERPAFTAGAGKIPHSRTEPERSPGWGMPIAAGLVGGLVGAGIVFAILQGRPTAPPAPDAALSSSVATLKAEIEALKAVPAEITQAKTSIEGVSSAAAEARKLAEQALAAKAVAPSSPPVDLAPLEKRLAEAEAARADLLARIEKDGLVVSQSTTALEARLAGLEGAAKVESGGRAAAVAIGLTALAAAVESGRPFVTELRAASAIVKDDDKLAVLAPFADRGAPTSATLTRDLDKLSPELMKALTLTEEGLSENADVLERVLNTASRIVIVRKVGEATDDKTAPLQTTLDALRRGDIAAAVAAFDGMDPKIRSLAATWRQEAKDAMDVSDTVSKLRSDALAALGG